MTTITESVTKTERETKIPLMYAIGIVFGILSGVLQVSVEDPLLTALVVTAATMALGVARPQRPWRWTLTVGVPVPLVLVAAKALGYYYNFSRATLAGSVLIILPGIAGAFGGSVMRRVFGNIFLQKSK